MSILDDLLRQGFIEPVEPDEVTAASWLGDAGRHIEAAQRVLDLDPAGAYVLAYDAARKSIAAALLSTGHRVRSRPGAHRALARYADHLGAETAEPAFGRFDRLRRSRNQSEYGSRTFGQAEVSEAIETATAIRAACRDVV